MMCVCNQGWSQVKVYAQLVSRGDPPKDSVCSVVHLSKAPLIITFFLDNVFVTIELNPGGQVFINSNCYHLHELAILNHTH
jgi:hypothetical protein